MKEACICLFSEPNSLAKKTVKESKRPLNFKLHLGSKCHMLQMVCLMMSRSLAPDALADVMNQVRTVNQDLLYGFWLMMKVVMPCTELIPTCKLAGSHTTSIN